nr:AAA family ATPase [uncultured Flavobacterium sp.]
MAKDKKVTEIRKVATSKQTGGGGFVFEDKASAWFISHFLSDRNPFTHEIGKIKKIEYQTRPEGWLFDDLLLTTEDSNAIVHQIAISSKSNIQINTKGPNNELLRDIWNQYLNINSSVFNKDSDYLCIANSKLPQAISKDLNTLFRYAQSQDAATLHQRINQGDQVFSQSLKKIYKGFYCPDDLAKAHNIDESETIQVISRLLLLEFDFENAISKDENQIITICTDCLTVPDGKLEQQLYKTLCSFRGELAPTSGFLDYQRLIDKLKNHFQLKGYTNHTHDWNKIIAKNKSRIDSIQDKIGNKLTLSNSAELDEIENLLKDKQTVFILGKSGYGKSVLAKKYIQQKLGLNDKYIWIDSQSFQNGSFENYFGLEHDLPDLFTKVQQAGYLFIDGIDRFFKEAELDLLSPILTVADNPSSSWKIIFTCQTDDFNDVLERLYRINVTLTSVQFKVDTDSFASKSELTKQFPKLAELFKHLHLRPILNNLKYLDLLAYNLNKDSTISESDFIGESTIIDWIWKEEIESKGSASSRFVKEFSEKQAENLSVGIAASDFGIADSGPVDILKQSKVFVENEDKLYLTHDLFGDWARYKLIRGNSTDVKGYLQRKELLSPLWCKAIRLYGIYLLDKKSDASEWIKLFKTLGSIDAKEKIIQDLLLESIIFSASAYTHLLALWDYFQLNNGELLKRFLERFLIKATLPNQNVLKITKELGGYTVAQASTYHRTPNHIYWGNVLKFLYLYKTEIITLAAKETAEITKIWLDYTSIGVPFRVECSEIAVENATKMFDYKLNSYRYFRGDADELIYKVMLLAVNEFPKEVLDLSLKLCKRIKVDRQEKKKEYTSDDEPHSIFRGFKIRDAIQWPHGPFESPDTAFEKICIDESALNPVINSFPETVKEILLALFIEAPKEVSFGYDHNYDLDINDPHRWFPPFYTRGSFLYFLEYQSVVGIDFIITLVNFATQQWTNRFTHEHKEVPKITINIDGADSEYIGDSRVYFWFRDSTGVPHSIVSALMALEKFLIDQIDAQESISDYISFILEKGNSLAYLGILVSIGKYNPTLFLKELKPLLQEFALYELEKSLHYGGHGVEGHQMMGAVTLGETTWNLAKVWHEMPHRKTSIQSVSLPLYINNKDLREYYIPIVESWTTLLNQIEEDGSTNVYLNNLINYYNIANYGVVEHEGHHYFQYQEPEELTLKYKEVRDDISGSNDMFTFPFQCFQELEKGEKHSLQECDQLWGKVQNFSKLQDEDPFSQMYGKYQSVLGGCAILVSNKDWIDAHPETLKWIVDYLNDVLTKFSVKKHDIMQADLGHSWQAFTARILALLWSNEVANITYRRLLGILMFKSSYATLELLFTSISKHLKWSSEDFIQVQNLAILWSLALDKDNRKNYSKATTGTIGKEFKGFNLTKLAATILDDFINGKTATALIDWSKLRPALPKRKRRNYGYHTDAGTGNEPVIDKEMIKHVFGSLPRLNTVDNEEREYVLLFWKQIVGQIIFELGKITTDLQERRDSPSGFHFWAMDRIAEELSEIRPEDNLNPEIYWKPIFDYGYSAGSWIDYFCFRFFTFNIAKKENHVAFFEEWLKMIANAYCSDTWSIKGRYDRKEIWEALMGLTDVIRNYWKNDSYLDFFKRIVPENIKWVQKHVGNQDIVGNIIYILKTKPGLTVIKEGLEIINSYLNLRKAADKLEPRKGYVRVDFKYEDSLATACSFLWEDHKEVIKGDSATLKNFKDIVTFLVARQNPIGLELQDRLLS